MRLVVISGPSIRLQSSNLEETVSGHRIDVLLHGQFLVQRHTKITNHIDRPLPTCSARSILLIFLKFAAVPNQITICSVNAVVWRRTIYVFPLHIAAVAQYRDADLDDPDSIDKLRVICVEMATQMVTADKVFGIGSRLNSSKPRTEPCGTDRQLHSIYGSDRCPSCWNVCARSVK